MADTPRSCFPGAIQAVVARLAADATLTGLLGTPKVYSRPPQGIAPPYVWVLSGEEVPNNEIGRTFGRRATLDLLVVSRYEGTEELDAIASRLMELLDNERLELPGYGFGRFEFVRLDRPVVEDLNNERLFERLCVFGVTAR